MPTKTRLLFFIGTLGKGGAEMHMLRLVNHLDAERFDVAVAVLAEGGDYESRLRTDVEIIGLNAGSGSTLLRYGRSATRLRRAVKTWEPDLVCPVMDLPAIVALAVVRGVPVVPLVQCVPTFAYGVNGGLVGRFILAGMRRLYPRAERIIALSHGVARDVQGIVGEQTPPIDVVHNAGVDDDVRASAARAAESAESLPGGPHIVACGRLMPVKGYPDLIEAMEMVVREVPGAMLRIVGDGPERNAIEALVAERGLGKSIHLLGFQSDPFSHMAAADVFALSSLHEGFGNVIVEAMACGTPVVSTDCPYGPGEIIENETSGLLVPVSDPRALADAILRLIQDPDLRASVGAAGRTRSEHFSAERIARQYEPLFERAVAL